MSSSESSRIVLTAWKEVAVMEVAAAVSSMSPYLQQARPLTSGHFCIIAVELRFVKATAGTAAAQIGSDD
jgi:hypothetical protein